MASSHDGTYGDPRIVVSTVRLPPSRRPRAWPLREHANAILDLDEAVPIGQCFWILHRQGFGVEQHPPEVIDRPGVPPTQAVRSVKCDQAGLRVHGEQERGDVAEPQKDLRIAPDHLEVEIGKHAGAAPAASNRQDSVDRTVGEEFIDVGGAILVRSREVSVARQQMAADLDLQAERLE